jgi:hypothetical protein
MKAFRYFSALLLAFAFTSLASAQTFYNNTGRQAFTANSGSTDEVADDTPFTGTQHVASFTFAYMNSNSAPVNATVRFYEVNSTTGFLGPLVATIPVENLIPGSTQFSTVNLPPSQQFDWTATPGIYHLQNVSGGFVSIQFTGAEFQQGWYTAGGPSLDGFYDVTLNQFENFNQDINASFYLQISSTIIAPTLSNILINPVTVKGGQRSIATVSITAPAPVGGTLVKLHSSKARVARIPASVLIPAGATSATVVITTIPVKTENTLVISATLNRAMEITNLFVTP